MKDILQFDTVLAPSLAEGLRSGLSAYATNTHAHGLPSTLWLRLGDGRALKVGVEMHDLVGWEEIGTLTFEIVSANNLPAMTNLPASWSQVRSIHKLIFISDECEAECGFVLRTNDADELSVVPGADVYTLAIKSPFHPLPFSPENDLSAYLLSDFSIANG